MSKVDINVDRRTDGLTDGQKSGRLYRTLLQAGAIKKGNSSARMTPMEKKEKIRVSLFFMLILSIKFQDFSSNNS